MIMKKILLARPSIPSLVYLLGGFLSVIKSRSLTNNGLKHQELSHRLKDYLETEHLSLFSNGHLALEAALDVIGSKGGEVITTPFTFASTTQAIIRKGFTPIFCDIDRVNYTMDPKQIEPLINENTVAILPVHVYGNVCDVEAIDRISKKYNLLVIYDSAHAFGVTYKSKSISFYGDFNMFSFHATKVFHTVEGGALTFKDKNLTQSIDSLKNFGIDNSGDVSSIGGNAKLNEFQAVIGLANLRIIDKYIHKRKIIAEKYDVSIPELKSWNKIKGNTIHSGKKLKIYTKGSNESPNFDMNDYKNLNNNDEFEDDEDEDNDI